MILDPRDPKIDQNGSQNRPKWWPGTLQKRAWKQVGFWTPKSERPGYFFLAFWHHFGDFGAHLGATWRQMAAQGCQNGAQNRSKIDAEIDAKINTEKVSKKVPKVIQKWSENHPKIDPDIILNVK